MEVAEEVYSADIIGIKHCTDGAASCQARRFFSRCMQSYKSYGGICTETVYKNHVAIVH